MAIFILNSLCCLNYKHPSAVYRAYTFSKVHSSGSCKKLIFLQTYVTVRKSNFRFQKAVISKSLIGIFMVTDFKKATPKNEDNKIKTTKWRVQKRNTPPGLQQNYLFSFLILKVQRFLRYDIQRMESVESVSR